MGGFLFGGIAWCMDMGWTQSFSYVFNEWIIRHGYCMGTFTVMGRGLWRGLKLDWSADMGRVLGPSARLSVRTQYSRKAALIFLPLIWLYNGQVALCNVDCSFGPNVPAQNWNITRKNVNTLWGDSYIVRGFCYFAFSSGSPTILEIFCRLV